MLIIVIIFGVPIILLLNVIPSGKIIFWNFCLRFKLAESHNSGKFFKK